MFSFIQYFFPDDLLVELSENKVTIKLFSDSDDSVYEDAPWVALEIKDGQEIIHEVGIKAKSMEGANIKIINPFLHSRSFVASFAYAKKILQYGVHQGCSSRFPRPSPRMVIHQLEKT
ncbi:rod shape-determining protein MreB, partial [Candidatus Albibeggiatoa sp. nov. BB20]|uniref:rod shape-determining protein MreB n=1 Tax=Candidatus Albibeggiatoa sp. nov. BB20 TaxID=3162723 RepID=UPI0033655159